MRKPKKITRMPMQAVRAGKPQKLTRAQTRELEKYIRLAGALRPLYPPPKKPIIVHGKVLARIITEEAKNPKKAIPQLETLLKDKDPAIRTAAAEALEKITGKKYPVK